MTARTACWLLVFLLAPDAALPGAGTLPDAPLRVSYPLPMSGAAHVTISADSSCDVRVSLYDVRGREVAGESFRFDGRGSSVWDLSRYSLPSGLYFLVARTAAVRISRKLLIVR